MVINSKVGYVAEAMHLLVASIAAGVFLLMAGSIIINSNTLQRNLIAVNVQRQNGALLDQLVWI